MKRTILRAICLIVVVALMAGFCVAYAATSEASEKDSAEVYRYSYYNFYLSLQSGGVTDLATPREKVASTSDAYYHLDSITNNTGYPLYINVRDSSGSYIRGIAERINVGETAPTYKFVDYLSGHGNIGTYYRPSGQTSSSSVYGGYIQGYWRP